MKKKDIPQDKSALNNHTRELCYAQGEDGEYGTALSSGWEPKTIALDQAWDEIKSRKIQALKDYLNQQASPIAYFMEKNLMDLNILASYSGFFKFSVKKHLKYDAFNKLSDKKMKKYADAFEISLEELKSFDAENEMKEVLNETQETSED